MPPIQRRNIKLRSAVNIPEAFAKTTYANIYRAPFYCSSHRQTAGQRCYHRCYIQAGAPVSRRPGSGVSAPPRMNSGSSFPVEPGRTFVQCNVGCAFAEALSAPYTDWIWCNHPDASQRLCNFSTTCRSFEPIVKIGKDKLEVTTASVAHD